MGGRHVIRLVAPRDSMKRACRGFEVLVTFLAYIRATELLKGRDFPSAGGS